MLVSDSTEESPEESLTQIVDQVKRRKKRLVIEKLNEIDIKINGWVFTYFCPLFGYSLALPDVLLLEHEE